jgi:aminopeptidase
MTDPRFDRLARQLAGHSMRLRRGEKVLIEAIDVPDEMVGALVRESARRGAVPLVTRKSGAILRDLLTAGKPEAVRERVRAAALFEAARMRGVDAYVALRGGANSCELADVPAANLREYQKHWLEPVHMRVRVPNTKWVVLRWPHPSMAQQAGMSTPRFEDFYFDVCLLDYRRMETACRPLLRLMEKTDRVRIVGPGTDLSFSIAGIPVVPCCGRANLPDGECFTAPVRDSVEGTIRFNAGTIYLGVPHDDVSLTFREGRVVEASSSDRKALERILDTDRGARYLGEFSLAFNPYISEPMRDILFDEKIRGSLHLALGGSYDDASNGNRSAVHWDLVLLQERSHGGGEVWFDGRCVRKNGRFLPKPLQGLNPETLGRRG